MVWQQRGARESEIELQDEEDDKSTSTEPKQPPRRWSRTPRGRGGGEAEDGGVAAAETRVNSVPVSQRNGSVRSAPRHTFSKRLDRSVSYQLATQAELCQDLSHERSHHTRRAETERAAAKLQRQAPPLPSTENPAQAQDSTELAPPNPVYYTPSSGEPPLLKLIAPAEESTPSGKRPCCGVM
ncbi:unnamed protein product [Staurois parvus]|uniref:Uncharacterized protein n=1 Tax=Staurois parvus TaxID=386267 RepID=A0ABN9FPI3_9NEOB|nr:unnamed protein product [Staurois parvus]